MKKKKIIYFILIAASILLRLYSFDYQTQDYTDFLSKWVEFYRQGGGFTALKYSMGNYNIPYLYFMALFSYFNINDLYLIKILSCLFDYLLTFSAYKIVKVCSKEQYAPDFAFFAVLFLPTVVLNSSVWSQCDSIYVSLALCGLYFAFSDRPITSMIFMALSFGFKLQAAFILPICVILLIMKKYKVWHFLIFPITYVILIMPAVLLGRDFSSALTLYLDQMDSIGTAANYNAPSFNAITGINYSVVFAFIAMTAIIVIAFVFRKHLNTKTVIVLSCLMVTAIPYLLPHMHDRYFFASDVLSVILIFSLFPCSATETALSTLSAILQQFGSMVCYIGYLTKYYSHIGRYYLTNKYGAIAVLMAIVIYTLIFVIEVGKTKESFRTDKLK